MTLLGKLRGHTWATNNAVAEIITETAVIMLPTDISGLNQPLIVRF